MDELKISIEATQRVLAAVHVNAGKPPPPPVEIRRRLDLVNGKEALAYQFKNIAEGDETISECYILFVGLENELSLCYFKNRNAGEEEIKYVVRKWDLNRQEKLKNLISLIKKMDVKNDDWYWWDGLRGQPCRWRITDGLKIYGIISSGKKKSDALERKSGEIFGQFLEKVETISGVNFDIWWDKESKGDSYNPGNFDNEIITVLLSSWMMESLKIPDFQNFRHSKLTQKYGRSKMTELLRKKLEEFVNDEIISGSRIFQQSGFKKWKNC